MSKTKDITKFSAEQLREFLMSFDTVMCDIDGVLWQLNKPIEGTSESLMKLQNLEKQVFLVTNNSTKTLENYIESAQHAGLNLSSPKVFQTDPAATLKQLLDRPSIKAVIVDFDVNCNYSMLALAISCLQRKDVLYITGITEEWLQVSPQIKILGPGPLINLISTQSGKKPISCGKPSQNLKDYILDKCNVTDPQRCLFIGDTANQDMKFASMCGFIKLFVGTGYDTLEQAQKEDDTCPDYYLPNLNQLFSAYNDPRRIANHKNS
ncbi:uncharacterized protein LOC143896951 isoform X2 [Temnothorax americanus]|uniref:uncharacterized protein LOC143896951 isoform X2 n=1 Tax=Temnothorax americanus TaxID=1964332 RepID=UPI0040689578